MYKNKKLWHVVLPSLCRKEAWVFVRYIVLIPFSTTPLLKESTHSSSNTCFWYLFLRGYLNKIHSFYNIDHALYITNISSFWQRKVQIMRSIVKIRCFGNKPLKACHAPSLLTSYISSTIVHLRWTIWFWKLCRFQYWDNCTTHSFPCNVFTVNIFRKSLCYIISYFMAQYKAFVHVLC